MTDFPLSPTRKITFPDAEDGPLLSTYLACKYLECSRKVLYRKVHQGDLRAMKLGRALAFRKADLDAHLEELKERKK